MDKIARSSPIEKFSILDREMCTCRLMSVLDVLSETLLQTIVTQAVRDLDVLLLTDKDGKASNTSDKAYLKSLKAFFASQTLTPWLI